METATDREIIFIIYQKFTKFINNNNNNGRNGSFFYVAGYLIEERRRWPVITASPRGHCSK